MINYLSAVYNNLCKRSVNFKQLKIHDTPLNRDEFMNNNLHRKHNS